MEKTKSNFIKSIDELTYQKRLDIQNNMTQDVTLSKKDDALLTKLANTYSSTICTTCAKKANMGRREAHINFKKEDFADVKSCDARQAIKLLLDKMTTSGEKLEGIYYEIWNNEKLTVHFSW